MSRCIAVVNEKGGTGKTTSVVECAFQTGQSGKSVLVVDLDPQSNATRMLLGLEDKPNITPSVFDLFIDKEKKIPLMSAIKPAVSAWPNTMVLPGSARMSTIDGYLVSRAAKESILKRILAPLRSEVDLILIDLGPAVNFLTLNALVAADAYLIPLDLSEYSQDGMETIHELARDIVESEANAELRFLGVFFAAFHKGGSRSVIDLEQMLNKKYGAKVINLKIPHSVKVIESQRAKQPVGSMDPDGRVSVAYASLSKTMMTSKLGSKKQ